MKFVNTASHIDGQAYRALWAEARGQELICIYHDVQDVADVSSQYNALLIKIAEDRCKNFICVLSLYVYCQVVLPIGLNIKRETRLPAKILCGDRWAVCDYWKMPIPIYLKLYRN